MAGGYNTNLERAGRVLHLQTQPRWRDPRVVETMVYDGGRIVASCVSTRPAAESPEAWMRDQHRRLIAEIEQGLHDAAIDPVSSRQALERVLDRLEHNIAVEQERGAEIAEALRVPTAVRRGLVVRWHAWHALVPVALALLAVIAWAPPVSVPPTEAPISARPEPTAVAPAPYRLEPPPVVETPPTHRPEPREREAATEVRTSRPAPTPEVATPPRPAEPPAVPYASRTETVVVIPEPVAAPESPVPPTPPTERTIERVAARPIARGLPAYPRRARRQGIEGTVPLTLDIDTRGLVHAVGSEPCDADPALIGAAIEAARDWRFAPATADGRPAEERRRVAIRFELGPGRSEVVRVVEDRPL